MNIYSKFGNSYGTLQELMLRKLPNNPKTYKMRSSATQGKGPTIYSKMDSSMIASCMQRVSNRALDSVSQTLNAYAELSDAALNQLVDDSIDYAEISGTLPAYRPAEGVITFGSLSAKQPIALPEGHFSIAAYLEHWLADVDGIGTKPVASRNISSVEGANDIMPPASRPYGPETGAVIVMRLKSNVIANNSLGYLVFRARYGTNIDDYCDIPVSIVPNPTAVDTYGLLARVTTHDYSSLSFIPDLAPDDHLAFAPRVSFNVVKRDPASGDYIVTISFSPDIVPLYSVTFRYISSGMLRESSVAVHYNEASLERPGESTSQVLAPVLSVKGLRELADSSALTRAGCYLLTTGSNVQLGATYQDDNQINLILTTQLGLTSVVYDISDGDHAVPTNAYVIKNEQYITEFPHPAVMLKWCDSRHIPVNIDLLIQDMVDSYDVKNVVSMALGYLSNPNVDAGMLQGALQGVIATKSPKASAAADQLVSALVAADKEGVVTVAQDMVAEANSATCDEDGNIEYGEAPYTVSGFLAGLGSTLLSAGNMIIGVALSMVSPVLGIVWTMGSSLVSGLISAADSTTRVAINGSSVLNSFNVSILQGKVSSMDAREYIALKPMIDEFGVAIIMGPGFSMFLWPAASQSYGEFGDFDEIRYETYITADYGDMPKVLGRTEHGIEDVDYVRAWLDDAGGFIVSSDGSSFTYKTNPALTGGSYQAVAVQQVNGFNYLGIPMLYQLDRLYSQMDPGMSRLMNANSEASADSTAQRYFAINLVVALGFIGTNFGTQAFFADTKESSYCHIGLDHYPVKISGVYGVNPGVGLVEDPKYAPEASSGLRGLLCLYLFHIYVSCRSTSSGNWGNGWETMTDTLASYSGMISDPEWGLARIMYSGCLGNEVLGLYPWTPVTISTALFFFATFMSTGSDVITETLGMGFTSGSATVKSSHRFTIPRMSKRAYVAGAVTAAIIASAIVTTSLVTKRLVNNKISKSLHTKQAKMEEDKQAWLANQDDKDAYKAYLKSANSYNRWCKWTGRSTINPLAAATVTNSNSTPNGGSPMEDTAKTAMANALGIKITDTSVSSGTVPSTGVTLPEISDQVLGVGAVVGALDVATSTLTVKALKRDQAGKSFSALPGNGNW